MEADPSVMKPSAILVLDTNVLLDDLTLIQSVQAWHSKFNHVIAIPWTVIDELDGLKKAKHRQKGKPVGLLAREAIRWVQESLEAGDGSVVGEKRLRKGGAESIGDDAILAYCLSLTAREKVPVTLLSNDNNLASKARANNVPTLTSTKPNQEPLTSEFIVRQAIHGPLPVDKTFIRPKQGGDICMLDLAGTPGDHLKFLPGLKGSRHAPRTDDKSRNSKIRIDLETGAVVLVAGGEERSMVVNAESREMPRKETEGTGEDPDEGHPGDGNTYADIIALQHSKKYEEMDWE